MRAHSLSSQELVLHFSETMTRSDGSTGLTDQLKWNQNKIVSIPELSRILLSRYQLTLVSAAAG